ncbi:MAG: DUF4382 domain-containing protein [Halovenus sp.]
MRDTNATTETNRRQYLKTLGAVGAAATVGLAGCAGDAAATGTLATAVTDQPGDIADFASCVVTIQGIWLKPATEGTATEETDSTADGSDSETVQTQAAEDVDQSDAREYHEFDEPQEADLVQLQDGNTELVDDREVETGSYEFLQLDVSGVEGTLEGGGGAQVDTPGNAPLQFKQAFEVRENERTRFVADFTPVKRGRTDRYLLQPVATGTDVVYEAETTATPEGTAAES